jgi:hypothetical protein
VFRWSAAHRGSWPPFRTARLPGGDALWKWAGSPPDCLHTAFIPVGESPDPCASSTVQFGQGATSYAPAIAEGQDFLSRVSQISDAEPERRKYNGKETWLEEAVP